jgi:hypothetical protein
VVDMKETWKGEEEERKKDGYERKKNYKHVSE